MSRIAPRSIDDLQAGERAEVERAVALMGFTPEDALVMARKPSLLRAMGELVRAVYGPGRVDPGLTRFVGEAASKAAGCVYCSAHAANCALDHGVDIAKIRAVWRFEESELFTPREQAAIRLGMKAGRVPNETGDGDFVELARWFDEDEILEIIAVLALFRFLNRWNTTLSTTLEPAPARALELIGAANA